MRKLWTGLWAGCLLLCLAACGKTTIVDLSGIPLPELKEEARQERYLFTLAMPDTWANWGQTWQEMEERYGITQQDLDMSSVEELEFFRVQDEKEATKDMGDVGRSYAVTAERENLLLKYRATTWDSIPDWAKDDDGDWAVSYTGCTAFLINDAVVADAPRTWQEVREGGYSVTVGDVLSSVQSQYSVIASAYAFGGSIDNLEPGITFWKELAVNGRLDKIYSKVDRIAAGKTDLVVLTDFNALNYRQQAQKMNNTLTFSVTIPQDGSLSLGYATIISKYAPHPHAAALAREYILSDEGQINLARGFARPVRDVPLPEEVIEGLLPDSEYQNIIQMGFYPGTDNDEKVEEALKAVIKAWQKEILPLLGLEQ